VLRTSKTCVTFWPGRADRVIFIGFTMNPWGHAALLSAAQQTKVHTNRMRGQGFPADLV
jgi:hypothetical protein